MTDKRRELIDAYMGFLPDSAEQMADAILSDRRRVLDDVAEPLRKGYTAINIVQDCQQRINAIQEALTRIAKHKGIV